MWAVIDSVGPEALPWLVSALPGLELKYSYEAWLERLMQRSPVANRLLLKFTDPCRYVGYFNICALLARLAPGSAGFRIVWSDVVRLHFCVPGQRFGRGRVAR